jgi:hypothetical protein
MCGHVHSVNAPVNALRNACEQGIQKHQKTR